MPAWQIFLRGLAMGTADLVPGISGGTLAFITGIYERLINALRSFNWRLVKIARTQGLQGVWQAVDGAFLLSLVSGIATAMLVLANLMSWLLETYPQQLNGFFFGLVAASAVVISRQISTWSFVRLIFLALGVILASLLGQLLPNLGNLTPLTFFIAGMVAICAMILPGISGSFLLLVMGLYAPFVNAIKTLDFALLLPFGMGALSGLLMFSHLLGWLFTHYRTATFALLFGFVVASLKHLWPWQLLSRYRLDEQLRVIPLDTQVLLPWHYFTITGEPSNLISVSALALFGWLLVLWVSPSKS